MKIINLFLIICVAVFGICAVSMANYVEPTGSVEGRMKVYGEFCDATGIIYTHDQLSHGKVSIYDKDGQKIDSDEVNARGKYSFDKITVGDDYYIKCEASNYVNAKIPQEDKYKSGKFDVKDADTVVENCFMMRDEMLDCDERSMVIDKFILPLCGSAQGIYEIGQNNFEGSFCQSGTVSVAPTFPESEETVTWVCVNDNKEVYCSAQKEKIETEQENNNAPIVISAQAGTRTPPTQLAEKEDEQPPILISTTLSLSAAALASAPLIPFPLQTSIFTLFATPFIKRRKDKFWGVVFDSDTKQPIKNVVVSLVDVGSNEKIETILTDEQGRYGFLLSKQAKYEIIIKKRSYVINKEHYIDPIYGKLYTQPQEFMPDVLIELDIAIKQEKVDWHIYTQNISKKILIKKIWNIFLYFIFVIGFIYAIYVTTIYGHWINYTVITVYAVTTMFLIFKKTKKHYGIIISKETNLPIPFVLVGLYQNDQRINFTVTDIEGRYYLLVKNGNYTIKIKGQIVNGRVFEKQKNITVKNGILKQDIKI